MTPISRRRFIHLMGSGAAGLSMMPLLNCYTLTAQAAPSVGRGFGPLRAKLPLNSQQLANDLIGNLREKHLLSLPDGFEYWIISPTGDLFSDGQSRVPSHHDGMAAFAGKDNQIVLVRNHEIGGSGIGGTRCELSGAKTYDEQRGGGTSTLVLSANGELQTHFCSLAGTSRNCAGGPTPWNTWLSCEEDFSEGADNTRHGYVFEVPIDSAGTLEPLIAMGRFNHEAAAVDPKTGMIYLTEDRDDSLLYRFNPTIRGKLSAGGTLAALKLRDSSASFSTAKGMRERLFEDLGVEWVAIDEVDPGAESHGRSTRQQGQSKGAARFSRGEGAWWGNDQLYFTCTSGGDAGRGQIFSYVPAKEQLRLIVESEASPGHRDNGGYLLAAPDNITVGPDGQLYVCEDGDGVEKIVGIDLQGRLFECARNLLNDSEFAGVCFSPNGALMFVNIQNPGLTCVIRGPWHGGVGARV